MTALTHDLVAEIVHNYDDGRVLVAVEGPVAASTALVADAVAESLRATGRTVVRASVDGTDPTLKPTLLVPFRRGELVSRDGALIPPDAYLVADGPFLGTAELRGTWQYRVWVENDPEPVPADRLAAQLEYVRTANPRGTASALVDVADPHAPRRVFSDSC